MRTRIFIALFFITAGTLVGAQEDGYRPELFFREDWKEIPAEIPLNSAHVDNPALELHLYGPGMDSLKKSHHDRPVDDPYYVWSGLCTGNWAVTLSRKGVYADLSSYARIRWRSKQAGLRELRILLKLADGTWLVSDAGDGPSMDWRIREFVLDNLQWYRLDISSLVEGRKAEDPDLSRVSEIGFTDLMRGGRSLACSRLDWIEVYGYIVPENIP